MAASWEWTTLVKATNPITRAARGSAFIVEESKQNRFRGQFPMLAGIRPDNPAVAIQKANVPAMSTPASTHEGDRTRCCIVGGGPAGVMLGFLLARAGVEVLVLEKHKDFFRDFRGDTIHPSTLELMHELGLLEDLLRQPHQELREITAHFGDQIIHIADFSHVRARCKFIAI